MFLECTAPSKRLHWHHLSNFCREFYVKKRTHTILIQFIGKIHWSEMSALSCNLQPDLHLFEKTDMHIPAKKPQPSRSSSVENCEQIERAVGIINQLITVIVNTVTNLIGTGIDLPIWIITVRITATAPHHHKQQRETTDLHSHLRPNLDTTSHGKTSTVRIVAIWRIKQYNRRNTFNDRWESP